MRFINKFLSSGHSFTKEESLLRFRVSLLNILMLVAAFFTLMNSLASLTGAVDFGSIFETVTLLYVVISLLVIYSLRLKRSFYPYVANFFIITSLLLFYSVLLTRPEDEFRLIAFFLASFISYVLMGKKYGLIMSLLIMGSIFVINNTYSLKLSEFALSTFFTFFLIFTAFLYFFLNKVEQDSLAFKTLNNALRDNILKEKQQRLDQEQILLRQCRMASMGEMLDSIAHQWRQPLMHVNAILLNMQQAIDTQKSDKEYFTGKINELDTLTQHMSQTIEDFRLLSKTDQKLSEVNVESAIEDTLFLMKNQLFDIEVSTFLDEVNILNGNKTELIQVFIIVLANAVEALNSHNIEDKKITIKIVNGNKNVSIFINDNADGIANNELTKIFDPYYTTKEQFGGTGLGLYIANIITTKMNGSILASNTTEGACFQITLQKINAINA